jgi:hypothetical protein
LSAAPIINRAYEFYLVLHKIILTFPKMERYSLGQKCDALTLDFLLLLLRANRAKNYARKNILFEASEILDTLKILVRITKDIGTIEEKIYLDLQSKMREVGQQLGGWIRDETKNPA